MAIWEENKNRYETRLEAFKYLCQNWWRFLAQKEGRDGLGPVIELTYDGNWLPMNVRFLCYDDRAALTDSAYWIFTTRFYTRVYTIDDLLEKLNWAFHPNDIKNFKIIYKEPDVPRGKDGRRKRK